MPLEENFWVSIKGRHLRTLDAIDHEILIGRIQFESNRELGWRLGLSDSAVQKRFHKVEEILAANFERRPTAVAVGAWSAFHLECWLRAGSLRSS